MPTVADLNVVLSASGGNFTSTMTSAVGSVGGLTAALGPVGIAIGATIGLLAAGAGAVTALAVSCGSAIDKLGDLSSKLGTSTEGLSALQYAADQNGSSAEAVATGIAQMNRRLAESAIKGGGAADALNALGFDLDTMLKMAPDQAFLQIADAIGKLPSAAERAAASTAIFGKSGQDLVPLFRAGGDAIKGSMEEAKGLGVAVSQFDTMKVQALWDAFGKVQAMLSGIGNSIIAEVAPYITLVLEKLVAWGSQSAVLQAGWDVAISFITGTLSVVADAIQLAMLAVRGLEQVFAVFALGATQAINTVVHAWDNFLGLFGGGIDTTWSDDLVKKARSVVDESVAEMAKARGEKWWSEQIAEEIDSLKTKADEATAANKEYAQSFAYLDSMAEASDKKTEASGSKKAGASGPTNPGAFERGSKEAFSAIYGNKSNQSIEKNTAEAAKDLKRIAALQEQQTKTAKDTAAPVSYAI